nr:MAG TPA: hypothetical protein [Caudoviricetes sp.]
MSFFNFIDNKRKIHTVHTLGEVSDGFEDSNKL